MQPHRCVFACMFGIRWWTSPCFYPSPSFLVFPMDVLRVVRHVPTLGMLAFTIPEIFGLGICWGRREVSRFVPPPHLVLLEEETLRGVLTWTGTGRFDPVGSGALPLRPLPRSSDPSLLVSLFLPTFRLRTAEDLLFPSPSLPLLEGSDLRRRGRSTESSTSAGILSGGTCPRGSPLLPRETTLPLWQSG